MRLGIGSYTFSWAIGVPGYPKVGKKLTAMDLINKAVEFGVEVVQICDNLPLHSVSLEELAGIKEAARKNKIKIEVGTRGVEPEHLERYLKIAVFFNSDILRVILHKEEGNLSIEEAYNCISQVLPKFEARNVKLAIENHEKHKIIELKQLIAQLDSPYVGICLDTVNSFGALEAPEQVIEALSPHMINLHYKDFTIGRLDHMMGFQITGCQAGTGMLEAEQLKRILEKKGDDISVILELWTPFTENVEATIAKESQWAKESINYLKEWIK